MEAAAEIGRSPTSMPDRGGELMSVQTPIRPDELDQRLDQAEEQAQLKGVSAVSLPGQRRLHVDSYGLVGLLIAAGGLAAVLALQWWSSNEAARPEAPAPAEAPAIVHMPAVPPDRDRWYLDDRPSLVPSAAAPIAPPMRDRWYVDSRLSAPPAPRRVVSVYVLGGPNYNCVASAELISDDAIMLTADDFELMKGALDCKAPAPSEATP